MCARFVRVTPADVIASRLKARRARFQDRPSYNIAPSQEVGVVINDGSAMLTLARWGYLPEWAKPGMKPMINARAETIHEKPSFRDAFRLRRCLIMADGFYEWGSRGGIKVPYYFRLASGEPFAMAGIYDSAGGALSCAIVTTEADGVVASVHERMPVMLDEGAVRTWIDPSIANGSELRGLLRAHHNELDCHEVSRAVNDPHNDSPENIMPVAA